MVVPVAADFAPKGYAEFKRLSSAEVVDLADRQVKWIQQVVMAFLLERLRSIYGDAFFDVGVPKEIQKACQAKRIDDEAGDKHTVETYLDWIQLQKIATQKEVRDAVKEVLSIQLQAESGGKHFYSGWFDAFNRIRRIVAHPGGRSYKDEDLAVLSLICEHLADTLPPPFVEGEFAPPLV